MSNICVISNAVLAKAACPEVPVIVDAAFAPLRSTTPQREGPRRAGGLQVQVTNRFRRPSGLLKA
ncbi:MAG: hypothetical protein ACLTMP_11580 [Eggerthella lenta]